MPNCSSLGLCAHEFFEAVHIFLSCELYSAYTSGFLDGRGMQISFGSPVHLTPCGLSSRCLRCLCLGFTETSAAPRFVLRPAYTLRGILPFRRLLLSTPKVICFLESPLQESWGKVVAALPPIANTVHLLRNLSAVCGQGLE